MDFLQISRFILKSKIDSSDRRITQMQAPSNFVLIQKYVQGLVTGFHYRFMSPIYFIAWLEPRSLLWTKLPRLYGHPPFFIFYETPTIDSTFFDNIVSMKYGSNTKINSCGKIVFSFLEDQNNVTCFFYKKHFYKGTV